MLAQFLEVKPRDFSVTSVRGLTNEAREAVNEVLKAMSDWRNEIANTTEKNGKRVIEKIAAAAAALGWPEQIVDATRTQMLSAVEVQIRTIDHIIDAWEEQLKLPNPMTASPSAMLSKLSSFAHPITFSAAWPMNPLQFWTQLGDQWQKSCADTMTVWGKRINLS